MTILQWAAASDASYKGSTRGQDLPPGTINAAHPPSSNLCSIASPCTFRRDIRFQRGQYEWSLQKTAWFNGEQLEHTNTVTVTDLFPYSSRQSPAAMVKRACIVTTLSHGAVPNGAWDSLTEQGVQDLGRTICLSRTRSPHLTRILPPAHAPAFWGIPW